MIFNTDFQDFICALNHQDVAYILVGGYSVVLHGYARNTGDMDIWVEKTAENYVKLSKAFTEFGMPVFDMTLENFLNNPDFDVFTFGRPPTSIDIMTQVKGLIFEDTFSNSSFKEVDNFNVRLISLEDLLTAKKAANRTKDLNDIENLTD